ncbi:hypothetical protein OAH12_01365 [Cyclobacteriaceae bacterium]|nr:hypothetical protein [Cyclobacteriaceae bacterium]
MQTIVYLLVAILIFFGNQAYAQEQSETKAEHSFSLSLLSFMQEKVNFTYRHGFKNSRFGFLIGGEARLGVQSSGGPDMKLYDRGVYTCEVDSATVEGVEAGFYYYFKAFDKARLKMYLAFTHGFKKVKLFTTHLVEDTPDLENRESVYHQLESSVKLGFRHNVKVFHYGAEFSVMAVATHGREKATQGVRKAPETYLLFGSPYGEMYVEPVPFFVYVGITI